MSSRIPSSAQPVATYTLTTATNTPTFDTTKYDSTVFEVVLSFNSSASSSVAKIETSNDDSTYDATDANKVTPATTGATTYRYIVGTSARYLRVYLTTVGGATLTVSINPM